MTQTQTPSASASTDLDLLGHHVVLDYENDGQREGYLRVLDATLPDDTTYGFSRLADDVYHLVAVKPDSFVDDGDGRVLGVEIKALFTCHAAEYHDQYDLLIIFQSYGDGRVDDTRIYITLNGETIDLEPRLNVKSGIFRRDFEEYFSRRLNNLQMMIILAMARQQLATGPTD